MAHLLNYKYEILPTQPQKGQIRKIMKQGRYQWNKAVTVRKKLKRALISGQFEYLTETLFSAKKNSNQENRKKAISELLELYPDVAPEDGPKFYALKNIVGPKLLDDFGPKYLDTPLLARTLKALHEEQIQNWKEDKKKESPLANERN